MTSVSVDEMRSAAAAERLLEETWDERSRRLSRRELLTETLAGALFCAFALALLMTPHATAGFRPAVAALLVALYVVISLVEFPVGAGHATPTQLVLVPMLVLLPPATVPPLVAAGYVLARLWDWGSGAGPAQPAGYAEKMTVRVQYGPLVFLMVAAFILNVALTRALASGLGRLMPATESYGAGARELVGPRQLQQGAGDPLRHVALPPRQCERPLIPPAPRLPATPARSSSGAAAAGRSSSCRVERTRTRATRIARQRSSSAPASRSAS